MIEHHDRVMARYSPKRTDDLKPGVVEWIGSEPREWEALWTVDEGPYEGQWAMGIVHRFVDGVYIPFDSPPPFIWVPECDLEIEPCEPSPSSS